MGDIRYELQGSFDPSKRFPNYGDVLLQMHIKGFRTHVDTLIDFESPVTAIWGVNGTGKSTVLQLAAAAYQSPNLLKKRLHISTFILSGKLDVKPFKEDASVEFTYADTPLSDGKIGVRKLTTSRSGSSWAGYDRQPARSVAYLGIGFYIPHAERDEQFKELFNDNRFEKQFGEKLNKELLEQLASILLCKYDEAHEITMKRKYAPWHTKKKFFTAKRPSGAEYSETNMGSGEARLYALIAQLETMSEKSLVLIEEPETALHPSAQFELGKYLLKIALQKRIQVIMSTHSEYLMLALPQKSRIYLKRKDDGVLPIPRISVRQAISMMDDMAIPSIYILVEDDVAAAIVSQLLHKHDPDFNKTARIVKCGDTTLIHQMMQVLAENKLPVCAIRDGDTGPNRKLNILKLFGTRPPEQEMFASAAFRAKLKEKFEVNWERVDIANSSIDHHHWFKVLETQTAHQKSDLLTIGAEAYLADIPEAQRFALVEAIKDCIP